MPVIAISDPGRDQAEFDRYADWVKHWVDGAEILRLSSGRPGKTDLEGCSGLILSGGGDVHPRFYGRDDVLNIVARVDERRDEFEFLLIESALSRQLPVLGICRGSQIFNVARGGTLIPDIEQTGRLSHRKNGAVDRVHGVTVVDGSRLQEVVGAATGQVNSSHHQSVDRPGEGLVVAARADDGIVESVEWKDRESQPFLMLVQWHPERMPADSPFARQPGLAFARATARTADVR